jgi:rubredoxin
MAKKWRCTVCDYVHEGPEPPEVCPVCGAGRDKFVAVEEEGRGEKVGFVRDMIDTFVLHGVAAHFPNGLLPTAALFIVIGLVAGVPDLEATVLYLLIVALAVVPVSFISGIVDWKRKFKGAKAPIFYKKIALAIILFVFGCAAVGLRAWKPGLWEEGGLSKWAYIGIIAVMLATTVLLGHYGGKLVFHWKNDG